jgi:hypothetical protein
MRGSGWVWFWVAAAAATLTKGPLGVLLGSVGLIASWWEKRGGFVTPLRGSHGIGLVIFFAITGAWFALAYRAIGKPLVDVMLGRELVGHAVHSAGAIPGRYFYLPTLVFLSRFAPWSVLTGIGLWRMFKQPASDGWERRFERFICCSFLGGLAIFSLAPHQRPDLIFPVIPFTALIAGRELSRWIGRYRFLTLTRITIVVALLALGGTAFKYHYSYPKNIKVIRTAGMRQLADTVRASTGEKFPLIHVDSPFTFQVFLNTKTPLVPLHEAAALLRETPAAFVVIADIQALEQAFGEDRSVLHRVASWNGPGKEALYIVSNHPRLEWATNMARPPGKRRVNRPQVGEE